MNICKGMPMNINGYYMKKTGPAKVLSPQLQIEFADVETLGEWWTRPSLPGIHWRLYHHSATGAGIIPEGLPKVEFIPERIYLIPPGLRVSSFCCGNPEQLFVHFTLNGCSCAMPQTLLSLPVSEPMLQLGGILREQLRNHPAPPVSQFYAIALVSLALTRLPPETLSFGEQDARIRQACEDLQNDPAHHWSNEELAQKYGFSADAFMRRFRQTMGVTPYHYLQNIRYALAAQLLESTSLSIGEICERIGINDPFHFSREFKRYHERSPSHYRKARNATTEL